MVTTLIVNICEVLVIPQPCAQRNVEICHNVSEDISISQTSGGGEGGERGEGEEERGREGVLKRRWDIVTFISFSTLKQQMIGSLWLILCLGLNMALGLAPGEWLNFDLAQYYN